MYRIWSDTEKNRLYISVGESNGYRLASLLADADAACRLLDSRFTCLIHFRKGCLLCSDEERVIFQLQDTLGSHGVGKAVYVRSEGSVLGRFQLEMLHIHSECPGQNASSLEEAETLLEKG
jgi:hypothetical protein